MQNYLQKDSSTTLDVYDLFSFVFKESWKDDEMNETLMTLIKRINADLILNRASGVRAGLGDTERTIIT